VAVAGCAKDSATVADAAAATKQAPRAALRDAAWPRPLLAGRDGGGGSGPGSDSPTRGGCMVQVKYAGSQAGREERAMWWLTCVGGAGDRKLVSPKTQRSWRV
jgi:hypothetical protein